MAVFHLLGPFAVAPHPPEDTVPVVRGPKVRTLLCLLLLNSGTLVTMDQMMSELWGERAVASAVPTVRTHVHRLRRALTPRDGGGRGARIHTSGSGYVLDLGDDRTDVLAFQESADRGRALLEREAYTEAARELRRALSHWRGPALVDVSHGRYLEREAALLEDQRLSVLRQRITTDLRLGRHSALVGELRGLVAAHPLDERLYGCLIESLYRDGRREEALRAYERIRRALDVELGLEPAPFLEELRNRIRSPGPGRARCTTA
ncbi:BTAD domain-containing putative transcriptional regulator [Streptomyces sp. NPDC056796]|uniref:AfsR/SARP family transcriptional regulator n=1 Tax=Streptomyces sp. NPDC056796 TaxID=3345947 RepID=UPI0036C1AF74